MKKSLEFFTKKIKLLEFAKESLDTIIGDIGCDMYRDEFHVQSALKNLLDELNRKEVRNGKS